MPRGGKRSGAGAKPSWRSGKTTTIRVPIELVEEILKIARQLDNISIIENETKSKINLSGIKLGQIDGELAVRLEDLIKAGYEIQPDKLAQMVAARAIMKSRKRQNGNY